MRMNVIMMCMFQLCSVWQHELTMSGGGQVHVFILSCKYLTVWWFNLEIGSFRYMTIIVPTGYRGCYRINQLMAIALLYVATAMFEMVFCISSRLSLPMLLENKT